MEEHVSKYGFYDEFNVKDRNIEYQPLSQSIKDIADKTYNIFVNNIITIQCSKSSLFKLFPIASWLSGYEISWFKKDFVAGITVAILLVPQSLAYAALAGLPPEWGLYASITPVILYIIFGTSTQIAIGPVATTAIMVASAVETIAGKGDENDPEYQFKYETIAMTLSFVSGVMLLLFGLLRAGFITVFLSTPVMLGFIMSTACIILIEQFRSLFGLDIPRSPLFYETLTNVFNSINTIHKYTTLVSVISLFLLYLPKWFPNKIPKWIPMPLFVIIIMVISSWLLDLESHDVSTVGNEIVTGFPIPSVPDFKYFFELIPGALVLAIVSYMGSIALAKGFDEKCQEDYKNKLEMYNEYINNAFVTQPLANTDIKSHTPLLHSSMVELSMSLHQTCTPIANNTNAGRDIDTFTEMNKKKTVAVKKPTSLPSIELDPNVEFIAFGIANLVGSFFGSQVISASFSRSALNNEMRGHTQISSFIQAIICLFCLIFLMPLLAPLPNAVLASVVAISVHRLIKNGVVQFIFLYNVSRIELIEFVVAVIAPWIVGLEIGIFVAIACSIIVSLIRHTFVEIIQLGTLKTINNENEYVDVEIFHQANFVENITILELKSELSFANNRKLIDKIRQLLNDDNKYIIISLAATQIIDTTSIAQIVTLFGNAKKAYIAFTYCRPDIIQVIKRFQLKKKPFPTNVSMFVSIHDAVIYFQHLMDGDNNNDSPKKKTFNYQVISLNGFQNESDSKTHSNGNNK